MFNIGIIGCGKISQVRHIPEYAQNPDARLAGFFDLNKERAKSWQSGMGEKRLIPMRNFWPTGKSTR